ncbi:MAG: sigma-70 family RNA polymerase sigma factor [Planctomycetales bacterium]|nr:sigma-70 family RNA polymerase sigma factor [Planctomycetales bacterium]
MSSASEESVAWVQQLVAGSPRAMSEFLQLYLPRLERLAAANMIPALRRRIGDEDIAQSVCHTFLRRAQAGQFELEGTASLWALLCAITLTKVRQHARFHWREKRAVGLEAPADAVPAHEIASPAPTPDEALEFAECMERFFGDLTDEERAIVDLRLQDCTQLEIAERLAISERTVRRLLAKIRTRWEAVLHDSISR